MKIIIILMIFDYNIINIIILLTGVNLEHHKVFDTFYEGKESKKTGETRSLLLYIFIIIYLLLIIYYCYYLFIIIVKRCWS